MNPDIILFDLDGTLTESAPGITNAASYALSTYGIHTDPASLLHFIGPPLHESFMKDYGFSQAEALEAVRRFRIYYLDRGWRENSPYPGIPELLEVLRTAGKRLIVATSKPEPQAKQICDYFGLSAHLELVCGADPNNPASSTKVKVFRNAL